jgi:hypothetical protein
MGSRQSTLHQGFVTLAIFECTPADVQGGRDATSQILTESEFSCCVPGVVAQRLAGINMRRRMLLLRQGRQIQLRLDICVWPHAIGPVCVRDTRLHGLARGSRPALRRREVVPRRRCRSRRRLGKCGMCRLRKIVMLMVLLLLVVLWRRRGETVGAQLARTAVSAVRRRAVTILGAGGIVGKGPGAMDRRMARAFRRPRVAVDVAWNAQRGSIRASCRRE